MKKIYGCMGVAAILASVPMSAGAAGNDDTQRALETARKVLAKLVRHPAGDKAKPMFRSARTGAEPLWKPRVQKLYAWEEEWVPDQTYTTDYFSDGKPKQDVIESVDGEFLRVCYGYDANGMENYKLSETSETGNEYEYSEKIERVFDPVVKNVVTENSQWLWMGTDWSQQGNNYHRDITRDERGNITFAEVSVLYEGEYDPTERFSVEYDGDGVARSVSSTQLVSDGADLMWEDGMSFDNIEWHYTDGQLYGEDSVFALGSNLMKSATTEMEGIEVEIAVDLDDDGKGYAMAISYMGVEIGFMTYTQLDEYGSFETTESVPGVIDISTKEVYFENGLLELSEYVEDGPEGLYEERILGGIGYDPETGLPEVYVQSMEFDGELENMLRIEFSDYVDVSTGISDVAAGNDAEVEYYTIDGVRVSSENLAPGLYVRRQGGRSSKVLVR